MIILGLFFVFLQKPHKMFLFLPKTCVRTENAWMYTWSFLSNWHFKIYFLSISHNRFVHHLHPRVPYVVMPFWWEYNVRSKLFVHASIKSNMKTLPTILTVPENFKYYIGKRFLLVIKGKKVIILQEFSILVWKCKEVNRGFGSWLINCSHQWIMLLLREDFLIC